VRWFLVEEERGRRDWSRQDRVIEAALARGLRVLAILAYAPSWARSGADDSTVDTGEYARFAAAAVRRYAPRGVLHYELWNEPNSDAFWGPEPDPDAYAALVRAAYAGMKAEDERVTVLAGSFAPGCTGGGKIAPAEFLEAMYRAGAGGSFDALSHHPYSFPALPGGTEPCNGWHQLEDAEPSLRSVMEAHGDGAKKVWATEFGAPVDRVGDDGQADQVSAAVARWESLPWAGPFFVYAYRDRDNEPFNLTRPDWSRRPAWEAYRDAIAAASRR
jgi:hypothetical protein